MIDKSGVALSHPDLGDEVVISGISGRFPQSNSVSDFFSNMMNKRDLLSKVPIEWNILSNNLPKRIGVLNEKTKFDSGFFGLHYHQAEALNPVCRLLLENSVAAVLDAGLHPSDLKGTKTGVFLGLFLMDFELPGKYYNQQSSNFGMTGCVRSTIAERISHYFELDGPTVCIDAACSSTAYALEHAFRAIRTGKCENAIVGGANLILSYHILRSEIQLGLLDPESGNNVFNENARGYTRSEAVSVIFLQKLKNSHRIYAQVIHVKTNIDGYKEKGFMHPSGKFQEVLLREVYQETGINPNTEIQYFESHSTGTNVGDPEELGAVDSIFCQGRKFPLIAGSHKSNMGHSEAASGLCALIKVSVGMEVNWIPPNINCANIRKDVTAFRRKRVLVAKEAVNIEKVNFIGINNSGFGGTNAHVVLKRLNQEVKPTQSKLRLVCVSGRTLDSLENLLDNISTNCHNAGYIGLLQHIFRNNIETFLYRGFALIDEGIVTFRSTKRCTELKPRLKVILNASGSSCHDFDEIACFLHALKKLNNIVDVKDWGEKSNLIIIQMGLIEIFKLLEIPIDYVVCFSKEFKEIVSRCFQTLSGVEYLDLQTTKNSKCANTALASLVICGLNQTTHDIKDFYSLLLTIGRLYELGFNPNLCKLYPTNDLPVKAPLISPLFEWDHNETWYMPRPIIEADSGVETVDFTSDIFEEKWTFLKGHVIDGRNLLPASAYLYIVWMTYLKMFRLTMSQTKITFERIKFHRPVILAEGPTFGLTTQIFRQSNRFEVTQSDELLVSGLIKISQYLKDQIIGDVQTVTRIKKPLLLNSIYQQLKLQHYNYQDHFQGLLEVDATASNALVKWNNNWITHIDHMLTINLLREDCKQLVLPTSLDRLVIDPTRHSESSEIVYSGIDCKLIKSPRVEIRGLGLTPITKKVSPDVPVLENHKFVPYMARLPKKDAVRFCVQIVSENVRGVTLRGVELVQFKDDLLTPSISELFSEFCVPTKLEIFCSEPFEVPNFVVKNKQVDDIGNETNFVIVSGIYEIEVITQVVEQIPEGAFILGEGLPNLCFNCIEKIDVISTQINDKGVVFLLRKFTSFLEPQIVRITEDLNWISKFQKTVGLNTNVLLLSEHFPTSGILGLMTTLKLEYGKLPMSCMFLTDHNYKFNLNDAFFMEQLKKSLFTNVLKNGKWGMYSHFLLDADNRSVSKNVVGTVRKGNISSFHWCQGPPLKEWPLPLKNGLINVYCGGLNFKDLMIASGQIDITSLDESCESTNFHLGYECSGTNVRGERVMALTKEASLSSIVVCDNTLTWKIPDSWSYEDAATVPVAYCTVLSALCMPQKLKPKQSILIHSASGGVGLAALNVATHFKCYIFVTVGSMKKRNFLKRLYPELEDSHIGNTRDSSFQQLIMKETNGKGVDIVLNSVRENQLHSSMRCVSSRGKFIEIGLSDVVKNNNLNLPRNFNWSFTSINLHLIFTTENWRKKQLSDLMNEGLRLRYIKPLPKSVYECNEVVNALNYMGSGKHTGKIVIKIRDQVTCQLLNLNPKPKFYCDTEKVYILVGGLGGFGLQLANWLVKRGARKLVIVSRRKTTDDYQNFKIEAWKRHEVQVIISDQNLQTTEGCLEMFKKAHTLGAVDGIFNLAAVLNDALIENQTKEKFKSALIPKVLITANLDATSRQICSALRYFVVFSSIISRKGNVGQANYAVGNSSAERICEIRKEQGYPALAIQWGMIDDVGMLEKYVHLNRIETIAGTVKQKISSCLQVLDVFLTQNETIVGSSVLANITKNELKKLDLLSEISKLAGINLKHVSVLVPLSQLGMDSITSVEIKQVLESKFEIYKSIRELRTTTLYQLQEEEKRNKFNLQLNRHADDK